MRIFPKHFFIQNLDAFVLRENFLVSGVVTIFVIRFYLKITNYPQLGGANLHIAHMLWGGLFMVIALLLLLSFISRSSMNTAAILGGIGFGGFIDELGKFITRDNNYFFQPTVAIIYVIFVLLYVLSKGLAEYQKASREEYLINALELTKDAVINDLDAQEKSKILAYLRKSDQDDPLVKALRAFIHETELVPTPPPSLWTKSRQAIYSFYKNVVSKPWFTKLLIFVLLIQSATTIVSTMSLFLPHPILTFDETGRIISSLLSAILVLAGLGTLRTSKILAYRLFKASVLLSLFLTQFFVFYQDQFYALIGLSFNILLLIVIDYVMDKVEKEQEEE
jgi:hypothetical protein